MISAHTRRNITDKYVTSRNTNSTCASQPFSGWFIFYVPNLVDMPFVIRKVYSKDFEKSILRRYILEF